jgi:hypothetical protein
MQPDPMDTTLCFGQCDGVPDEVSNAVFDVVKSVPVGKRGDERITRAVCLAPRMAVEGWRFCPCFPMARSQQHELIFSLVDTYLANQLAYRVAHARVAQIARVPILEQDACERQ